MSGARDEDYKKKQLRSEEEEDEEERYLGGLVGFDLEGGGGGVDELGGERSNVARLERGGDDLLHGLLRRRLQEVLEGDERRWLEGLHLSSVLPIDFILFDFILKAKKNASNFMTNFRL